MRDKCGNVHCNLRRARLQPLLLYLLPFTFSLHVGIFKLSVLRAGSAILLPALVLMIIYCKYESVANADEQ
jgi:hypothetical protein